MAAVLLSVFWGQAADWTLLHLLRSFLTIPFRCVGGALVEGQLVVKNFPCRVSWVILTRNDEEKEWPIYIILVSSTHI